MLGAQKILEVGNYPPPMCGWAMQTCLLVEELRRRGHVCAVLKINENRRVKSPDYVDVQNALDYLLKLFRFAFGGYRIHAHVNGESVKGYFLAVAALLCGRMSFRSAALTFHGGIPQTYFPRRKGSPVYLAFWLLFHLAGTIVCNSLEIKQAIEGYGVAPAKLFAIPGFSPEYLRFERCALPPEIESFLAQHEPVFLSYLSFRPEYKIPVLRRGMQKFREKYPRAGFIWLGFPEKERKPVQKHVNTWAAEETQSLLLLGNLSHDQFLTLLSRCHAFLRTPACDGVSASVLESLALGVPVVASENGRRPDGVLTYREDDADHMVEKLVFLVENYASVKNATKGPASVNNIQRTADWLVGAADSRLVEEVAHAG